MRKLLLIMLLSLLPIQAWATPAIVAWWKFDEGTGTSTTADSSGNGYTGTLVASPSWVTGKIGPWALSFNGSTQAVSTGNIDLTATNVISISLWLKVSSFANDDSLAMEISTDSNSSAFGGFIDPNDSAGFFAVNVHGDVGNNYARYTRPSTGVWHNYVATFDKSQSVGEVNLYIDAVLQTPTRTSTSDNTNNFGNVPVFMMSRNAASLFLTGSLDDVRIYNGLLSQADVTNIYNGTSVVPSVWSNIVVKGGPFVVQ